MHLVGVGEHRGCIRRDQGVDLDGRGDGRSHQFHALDHDRLQEQHLAGLWLLAAEGEDLPDQIGGAVGGLDHRAEVFTHRGISLELHPGKLGVAADCGQDVVEIVRDAAGKLAERFHLLRLQQMLLGLFALGDVRDNSNVADELIGGIPDLKNPDPDPANLARRSDDAVLDFQAGSAVGQRGEGGLHPLAVHGQDKVNPRVWLVEQAGDRAAPDFLKRRAHVVHVAHVRRADPKRVRDIVGQLVELLVAFSQSFHALPALGDVARQSDQADDLPGCVAQRNLRGGRPGDRAVRPGLLFLETDDRLARRHDLLFALVGWLRVFRGEVIQVRPADGFPRIVQAYALRHAGVDPDEAALPVLDVDVVGDCG